MDKGITVAGTATGMTIERQAQHWQDECGRLFKSNNRLFWCLFVSMMINWFLFIN